MDKYIEAARIGNEVISEIIKLCTPQILVRDICKHGDEMIQTKISSVFKAQQIEKGIAMPTCLNVNNIVSGYTPLSEDDTRLCEGDVVKVQLGVHIDGHVVHCGHTVIVKGDPGQMTVGKSADVVCAAYFASELVLRMLSPGVSSDDIQRVIERTCKAFRVCPVAGVACASTTRFAPHNPNKMLVLGDEGYNESFTVGENEAYIVSIKTSSGDGACKEAPLQINGICQRNVHTNINLKLQTAKHAFEDITNKHSVFPFAIRDLDAKTRLGLNECVQKDLFYPVDVMACKKGNVTAEFTFTVLVSPAGVVNRITRVDGLPYVHSEYSLPEDLQQLMESEVKVKQVKDKRDAMDTN